MNLVPTSFQIPWRKPWHPISSEYAIKAATELRREICDSHLLFQIPVSAIGCRQDCDDVLFHLSSTPDHFAVVHLSYQKETQPDWPETHLFDSLNDWIERCMIPEADDFASGDDEAEQDAAANP